LTEDNHELTYEELLAKAKTDAKLTEAEIDRLKYPESEKDRAEEEEKELTYEELLAKAKSGEKLTEKETETLKFHTTGEENEQVKTIIRGVNNVWRKKYNFKERGLEFTVAVHAPSMIEQGKVHALRESYLGGVGTALSQQTYMAFYMLATLRICGEEIPRFLENDENIYAADILYIMGMDFVEWLDSFRY
jgi:arginine utilization protein RocB